MDLEHHASEMTTPARRCCMIDVAAAIVAAFVALYAIVEFATWVILGRIPDDDE